MAQIADFRKKQFGVKHVNESGRFVGRTSYAKLYQIENLLRVVVHSVLSVQVGPDWWTRAVAQPVKDDVERFKKQYVKRPWHSTPGPHDIYYTGLKHLNEIIRSNRDHFDPVILDVDKWIAEIEQVRLPRNIVGHMNYPHSTDQKRIEVLHADCLALVETILLSGRPPLRVP